MIELEPNHTYRLRYLEGKVHKRGATIYFQPLSDVPAAKHLIKVRNLETGEIADLIELLAHPWDVLDEYNGELPASSTENSKNILQAIVSFFLSMRATAIHPA